MLYVSLGRTTSGNIDDLDEASEIIPYTYSITSYGAAPSIPLLSASNSNDIIVPKFSWTDQKASDIVGLQREYVWPVGTRRRPRYAERLRRAGAPAPDVLRAGFSPSVNSLSASRITR